MTNKQHFLKLYKFCWFLCILTSLVSCNWAGKRVEDPITIHLFKWTNSAVPSSIELNESDSWKPLLNVDLNDSDFIINEEDIISYDWENQEIHLTNDVISRMDYDDYGWPKYSYFIVVLGDKPVLGGALLSYPSAIWSGIPVLYVPYINFEQSSNNGVEILLRGNSSYYSDEGLVFVDELDKNFRNRLHTIGKLSE